MCLMQLELLAGLRPNIDWWDSHRLKTVSTNVVGTLTLADVCAQQDLYLMNF